MKTAGSSPRDLAGRLASRFADSPLTALMVVASLLLGLAAVILLPREEEPQIKVPMVDIMVAMPGATAREVENRVTRPLEKLLWEIPGVEYLYATSRPGSSQLIVRFRVGSDLERSLVRLSQKLAANADRIPPGAAPPLVKPRTIDDVPVFALTFHSPTLDHLALRRLAAQVEDVVKALPDVAETTLIGGLRRQLRIEVDPVKLASFSLTLEDLAVALRGANVRAQDGAITAGNQELLVQTGAYLGDAADAADLVIGVAQSRPIFLRDVAEVRDGPPEPADYVLFGRGPGRHARAGEEPAVTLSIAKRPGTNAVTLVDKLQRAVGELQGVLIPADVTVTVTRDYGTTARAKSDELLWHMGIAVFGVALIILAFLGWRESLVVLLAIPVTLGLTLLVFFLYGYTLNRITLFALIFSIGILVDDAIVVVENIVRYLRLPEARARGLEALAVEAVSEVGKPTVLATWAVIAAVLPMAFVGGLMGPYMRPIPIGASAAMLFSLAVAFVVTPWAALRVLRRHTQPESAGQAAHAESRFTRFYRRVMDPMIARRRWRWTFLALVAVLLLVALGLVGWGAVKVKMLPFDNKSEFQVLLNLPEGTALEETARVGRELARAIRDEPEVRDYQLYVGTAAPFNFNGLVRHYYERRGAHVADLQVNLAPKNERAAQSHDVAVRLRPRLAEIAARHGAALIVAEVPPGPPVLQTLVAEVYGPSEEGRLELATDVRRLFAETPGVVDIDWYVEDRQPTVEVRVDRGKAALHGISVETVARTLRTAVQGERVGLFHQASEVEDADIVLVLPRKLRSRPEDLLALQVGAPAGNRGQALVPLSELVTLERIAGERYLYRKNLRPVTFVTADVAGPVASPAYAVFALNRKLAGLDGWRYGGSRSGIGVYHLRQPDGDLEPAIKWDGEWHVTLEVFRDLGIAFAAVCLLIYMLLVGWFDSYVTPLVIMVVIPLSLIGILPAHALAGAYFTATSMIGFMAGAGIVVRNSIILVDFIELRRAQDLSLAAAVVEAGAVRFRPMLLTALAVIAGASVILADPIFQGLALSLMAGEVASLLVSRFAVPILYFMVSERAVAPP